MAWLRQLPNYWCGNDIHTSNSNSRLRVSSIPEAFLVSSLLAAYHLPGRTQETTPRRAHMAGATSNAAGMTDAIVKYTIPNDSSIIMPSL